MLRPLILAAALVVAGPFNTHAQDVAAGESSSRKCLACHSIGEGAAHRLGPVLNGVLGRVAGTQDGYVYSNVMREAGADGLVWTEETLSLFLDNPRQFLPGTAMAFIGIADDAERANVIAYLRTFSPDYTPPLRIKNPPPPVPSRP